LTGFVVAANTTDVKDVRGWIFANSTSQCKRHEPDRKHAGARCDRTA